MIGALYKFYFTQRKAKFYAYGFIFLISFLYFISNHLVLGRSEEQVIWESVMATIFLIVLWSILCSRQRHISAPHTQAQVDTRDETAILAIESPKQVLQADPPFRRWIRPRIEKAPTQAMKDPTEPKVPLT